MKTFTAPMTSFLTGTKNIEPVIVLGIHWYEEGSEFLYADKDIHGIDGKILDIQNINSLISDKTGQTASMSVVLDDTDGTIKSIIDQTDVFGKVCYAYQLFDDPSLSLDDKFVLFKGKINFDVAWSEGERTVSFQVITDVEEREVGFSPEEGQFDFVSSDAVGKPWPLCFGSPLHVPATRVKQVKRAKLNETVCLVDAVLIRRRDILNRAIFENYAIYRYYATVALQGVQLRSFSAQSLLTDLLNAMATQISLQIQVSQIGQEIMILRRRIAQAKLGKIVANLNQDLNDLVAKSNELSILLANQATITADILLDVEEKIPDIQTSIEIRKNALAKQLQTIDTISKLYQEFLQVQLEICKQEQCVKTQVHVQDGEVFPQNTTLDVFIKDLRFRGSFNGNIFNIISDLPKYTNVVLGPRQTITDPCLSGDEEYATFWVPDVTFQIKGMYALVKNTETNQNHIIKIEEQVGTKCTMVLSNSSKKTQSDEVNARASYATGGSRIRHQNNSSPLITGPVPLSNFNSGILNAFTVPVTAKEFNPEFGFLPFDVSQFIINNIGAENISESDFQTLLNLSQLRLRDEQLYVALIGDLTPRKAFTVTAFDFDTLIEVSPIIRQNWLDDDTLSDELPSNSFWTAEKDTDIIEADESCEIYVANLIPSISVKSVSAYRVNSNGVRSLTSVPSQNYTIGSETLESVPPGNGLSLTTIRIAVPLSTLNQGWEDQIYVSLISSQGPNVSDIIRYLLETYTDKIVDTTSFDAVKTSVANYPANFALLTQKNVFQQVNEIAQQARCVVYERNDIYYIKYLSIKPSPDSSLGENKVVQGSLEIGFSDLTDLTTKLVALWKPDYLPETETNRLTLRHNVTKYGIRETEMNFYIYNIESLVLKSATFWLIRFSNPWKIVTFDTVMSELELDVFDAVTLTLPDATTGNILGLMNKVDYNPGTNNIQIEAWLPVRSGEMTEYEFAWPGSVNNNVEFPEQTTIDSGFVGSGNPVITGQLESC